MYNNVISSVIIHDIKSKHANMNMTYSMNEASMYQNLSNLLFPFNVVSPLMCKIFN